MASNIKILVHSKDDVLKEIILEGGQPTILRAQQGVTYEVKELTTGTAPKTVLLKRKGDNLELYINDDSTTPLAVIEDYYLLPKPSPLVGLAENGMFYPYVPQSGNATQLPWQLKEGDSSKQILGYSTQGSVIPWWPIIIAGVLIGGGIAAASSSSSSVSSGPIDTEAPKVPVTENITNNFDENGNLTDTTIRGEAEPGSTVDITDPVTGDVVGTGTADADGHFEIVVEGGLKDGQDYDVTAKDPSGNASDKETITGDAKPPEAPTVSIGNGDEFITEDEIDGDGNVDVTVGLPSDAKPGDTVVVNGKETELTEEDINKGEVTVKVPAPEEGKTLEVEATIKDQAGNESDPTTGSTTVDTTAPEAPTLELAEDTGSDATDSIASKGTVNVSGLEADATWEYSTDGGDTWTDGIGTNFELEEGEYAAGDVVVRQTDAAGNTSNNGELGTVTIDTTAPDAPTLELTEVTGSDDSDGITSKGTVNVSGLEADATWEYSTDGGDTWTDGIGTNFELEEGEYADGQVLVRQTDAAGNTSNNGELGTVTIDTTAPDAPTLELTEVTGSDDSDGITSNNTVNVDGLEADATWEYSTDGGTTWTEGSGTSFELSEGEYAAGDVVVRQTDAAGNTSDNGELGCSDY
ncbi:Ig-like domain-containing protein [Denitrificimonas sp. JX-1]|uniref:Ig-like domain-containing protein n=1 Tax=Denitrificimonas halotolerans TaxID=3098930 RepID=A0ABU5GU47_9GAMM|nr:Ig-like domain-containing protein [Denitrificimonas sp. JX-1]MDY7220152.1 Ig-like domain-containing protein [Denitrificimonas sp. JX-1]